MTIGLLLMNIVVQSLWTWSNRHATYFWNRILNTTITHYASKSVFASFDRNSRMHCLNCSSFHAEEVLLCKFCRLPLWNLIALIQKCGVCGKRLTIKESECTSCSGAIAEPTIEKSTQLAPPKINREISASTIFVEAEDEKRRAKQTNLRVKFILWLILLTIILFAVVSALIWLYDPYYFYEAYYSLRRRWLGGG